MNCAAYVSAYLVIYRFIDWLRRSLYLYHLISSLILEFIAIIIKKYEHFIGLSRLHSNAPRLTIYDAIPGRVRVCHVQRLRPTIKTMKSLLLLNKRHGIHFLVGISGVAGQISSYNYENTARLSSFEKLRWKLRFFIFACVCAVV